jgi:two-component system, OmpR family, phosphate regulon sensor histidine kinase PhoR
MTQEPRSMRAVWFAWWSALLLVSLVSLFIALRSAHPDAVFVVAFVALVLALALAVAMVRSAERSLRGLRQFASDLATGNVEVPAAAGSVDYFSAAQAVGSLAGDLRSRLEELRQERDQLSVLLEFGTDGLLQINSAGRILHVNPAAARLLGLPADSRGQSILTLVRQADLRDLLMSAAGGGAVQPYELVVEDRQLVAVCRPLPQEGGAVAAIVDLTAIRRLEAVRRDFVANVSHELKTPLTSIRGYTETLMAEDLPFETRKQFLDVVQKNTTRIQRIVDDLLDLSRLQSGGWRPELQEVDAAELAADVWTACAESARTKGINFDIAQSAGRHVAADPGGLRQVLSNLYDNAIRYTSTGGRINVRILEVTNGKRRIPERSDWVEIQVQDTGMGIPREALPRIFERFYRVDPARSRADGGTGLGLSIVKHLVEQMEGVVTAESELGKGTTIRVRLRAA